MTSQETNYKPGWPKQMGKIPEDHEMDEAQDVGDALVAELNRKNEAAKREKETRELMSAKGAAPQSSITPVKTGLPQDDQLREVLQTWEKKGSDRAAEIRAKIEEKTRLFKVELAKMEADLAAAENTVSMARNGMAYTPPIVDHDAGTDGKDVDG